MGSNQSRSEFIALLAAATAATAIAIDAMLPAFESVRAHFGLDDDPAQTALIVTVFISGLGFGQIVYGPLSDRFGRKPIIRLGLLLYIGAGLAASFAGSFETLLVWRFIWGLGSAGPRSIAYAILRDRFSGDALTRAMAIMVTIFLIVPTVAPLLGQWALALGSWRYSFLIGPVFAALVTLWTFRLEETLAPQYRRSIAPIEVAKAVWIVLKTPSALAGTIGLTVLSASFLPYLGSAERIFGSVYGRGDEFAYWFALNAILMAGFTLTTRWVVKRLGSMRTRRLTLVGLLIVSGVYVAVAVAAGGTPSFAAFFILTTFSVGLETSSTPLLTSSALDDVGHVAGTASSFVGAVSLVGGAQLARFIDEAIDDTVTPFAVGFLIASGVALVANEWSSRRSGSGDGPTTPPPSEIG